MKALAILIANIAPKSHDLSQSPKLNMKISILFFLSRSSSITQKVYSVYGWSTHQMNVLLSEIFLFLVRAACEPRSTRYGPKRVAVAFLYAILCVIMYTTRKLQAVKDVFTYLTIALLSEIPIPLVRAVCEIQLASYESKHGMQLLFVTTFRAYLHL